MLRVSTQMGVPACMPQFKIVEIGFLIICCESLHSLEAFLSSFHHFVLPPSRIQKPYHTSVILGTSISISISISINISISHIY
jgi:hypothetical protein